MLTGGPFSIGNNFTAISHGRSCRMASCWLICRVFSDPTLSSLVGVAVAFVLFSILCFLRFLGPGEVVPLIPVRHIFRHARPVATHDMPKQDDIMNRNFTTFSRFFVPALAP